MKKVFYTEKQPIKAAIATALSKALAIISSGKTEVGTIILLFPTYASADEALDDIFPQANIASHRYHCEEPSCGILIETLKNYSASFPHILIPIFISEKDLARFEDEYNALVWVVVPPDMSQMENWLKIHSAVNVDTKQALEYDGTINERVINAIEWLRATSYPNEGFVHPLDLNRLKSMANALATNQVPVDYYSVLHYCITHKINHEGGRMIADHFVKAQTRKFKTDGNYSITFLTEMMNSKHTQGMV